jgi:ribosomal protein S18 acetylase RimI-like enzyme
MTTFRIRSARAGDLSALTDVFRRSSLSNDGDQALLLAHPDALVLSAETILAGGTRLATEPAHSIVGFVTSREADGVLELEDLFVDPDWMRNGIATLLMHDVAHTARQRDITRIEVTANPHALAFYRHVGFRPAGDARTRFGLAPRMHLDLTSGIKGRSVRGAGRACRGGGRTC